MEFNEVVVTFRGLVGKQMLELIKLRDEKMVEADHLVNTALDNGVNETPFRHYRQALRDIPQTYSNPEDVVWPQKPSF